MNNTGHCKALCVSRKRNSHINCIYERALKIVYQDHNSTFNDLLAKDDCFKIHDRNLNKLLIQMFKLKMRLALEIMSLVFDIIECLYPLKNELRFKSRNIRTVWCETETAAFIGSTIQSHMQSELLESTSLNKFRSKTKSWKKCPSKLRKIYL